MLDEDALVGDAALDLGSARRDHRIVGRRRTPVEAGSCSGETERTLSWPIITDGEQQISAGMQAAMHNAAAC